MFLALWLLGTSEPWGLKLQCKCLSFQSNVCILNKLSIVPLLGLFFFYPPQCTKLFFSKRLKILLHAAKAFVAFPLLPPSSAHPPLLHPLSNSRLIPFDPVDFHFNLQLQPAMEVGKGSSCGREITGSNGAVLAQIARVQGD